MWRWRASIFCQPGFKDEIDLDLLRACIESNVDDREFLVRKAVGRALLQHAWTDPGEVIGHFARQGSGRVL